MFPKDKANVRLNSEKNVFRLMGIRNQSDYSAEIEALLKMLVNERPEVKLTFGFLLGGEPMIQIDDSEIFLFFRKKDYSESFEKPWLMPSLSRITQLTFEVTLFASAREVKNEICKSLVSVKFKKLTTVEGVKDVDPDLRLRFEEITNQTQKSRIPELLQSGQKVFYNRLKVILLGEGRSGKTSILKSLLDEEFDHNEASTIVGESSEVKIYNVMTNWQRDGSGTNHFLSKEFAKYAENIDNEKQELVSTGQDINVKIVVEELEIKKEIAKIESAEEVDQLQTGSVQINAAKQPQMPREELANLGSLSFWDLGGQKVFSALHHLYITDGAVFILAFDCTKILSRDSKKLLKQWLGTVILHSPSARVLLVGTRGSEIGSMEGFRKINDLIKEVLDTCKEDQTILNEENKFHFFPIENSDSIKAKQKYLQPIRKALLKIFMEQGEENTWKKEIPLAWMFLMNFVVKEKKPKMLLPEIFELGDRFKAPENEMRKMISFYSRVGAVLDFTRIGGSHEGLVIIEPQWLLNILRTFIFDENVHEEAIAALKRKGESKRLLKNYLRKGILSSDFMKKLFEHFKVSEENIEFVLGLSSSMLLVSKMEEGIWIVPQMVKQPNDLKALEADIPTNKRLGLSIFWGSFVPPGLFERVVCLTNKISSRSGGQKPSFWSNAAFFFMGSTMIFLLNKEEVNEFEIFIENTSENSFSALLEVTNQMIRQIRNDVLGQKFSPIVLVRADTVVQKKVKTKTCLWNSLERAARDGRSKFVEEYLNRDLILLEQFEKYMKFEREFRSIEVKNDIEETCDAYNELQEKARRD